MCDLEWAKLLLSVTKFASGKRIVAVQQPNHIANVECLAIGATHVFVATAFVCFLTSSASIVGRIGRRFGCAVKSK